MPAHLVDQCLLLSTGQHKPVLALKGKQVAPRGAGIVLATNRLGPPSGRLARSLLNSELSDLKDSEIQHTHTMHSLVKPHPPHRNNDCREILQ